MTRPDLHIITFAVPYPSNYGGAIDVWNRIVALRKAGVRIHLHCFVYGLFEPQPILETVADKVHYYPRVIWPALISKGQPYIVTSRKSQELLNRLKADNSPVLFEGIHTTGFFKELEGRKRMLRAHNIEHQYYQELSDQSGGFKSLVFRREALCLRDYEHAIARQFDVVFAISPQDAAWYDNQGARTLFIPPFHGHDQVDILTGHGQYLLYQGDLSIEINQESLLDMLARIPSGDLYPVVAAGRSGSKAFEEKLARFSNLRREADVTQEKMIALIRDAHIILVHSLHGSGMKLKIFPALYHGRFVAATAQCRTGTSLDQAITYYQPSSLDAMIKELWASDFSELQIAERIKILAGQPDDDQKAKEIIRYL